jgi:D-alanyl-D-alanine carboxypeptidase
MPHRAKALFLATVAALSLTAGRACAEALLLVEADSGKVLHAENATYPWYPASVTKLMTAYVTLRAVKEGRITLDTPIKVSETAVAQSPSKMGFPLGTLVTVDNALKMLMVKSANDVAVVLAEGVGGSVEGFSEMMNRTAKRLGMTQTHYVNPNGLPDEQQVTSARDLAILARTIIREFPEHEMYWHLPGIKFGRRLMRNHNSLIGRYQGADGMKTGFICSSGFNVVATATRNGRRLVAVVLGAPSSSVRAAKAAHLLERGFNSGNSLSWLTPSLGSVEALVPIQATPPDMRDQMCGKSRRRPAAEEDDSESPAASASVDSGSPHPAVLTSLRPSGAKTSDLLGPLTDAMPPAYVYTGPKRADAPQFAVAAAPKRVAPKPPATASADAGTPRHRSLAAGASSRASFVPPTAASAAPSPNLRIAAEEPGEPRAPKKPKRTLAKPKPQTATIPVAAAPKPATAPKPAAGAAKPAAAKPAAVARPAVAPKPAAASATAPKPAAAKPIAAPKPSGAPKPAASTPSAPRAAAPPKPQAAGRPANAPRTASAPNLTQQ